jgi:hypothetical protein
MARRAVVDQFSVTPLIFDRPGEGLYEQLTSALALQGGVALSTDGSAASCAEAMRRLPQGVMPEFVIGAPLATRRSFEALSGTDIEAFSVEALLGLWSTLSELCRQPYPQGASIVVLQSVIGLERGADTALARATLFAARAMIKAAVLETRERSPALRFNLLLVPPDDPPLERVLSALEQIAASPFLTGTELVIHAPDASHA